MNKRWLLSLVVAFLLGVVYPVFSQEIFIKGKIVDRESRKPLAKANVVIKGNLIGVSTNDNGEFTLKISDRTGSFIVSHLGYQSKTTEYRVSGKEQYFTVLLKQEQSALPGTVIGDNRLLNIAQERKTPVAVSSIGRGEILERLANRDFPEILNRTPSVYTKQSGGGFGDTSINIRGFSQENVAVLINGIPVNDMENGRIY